jgi:DNA repair protein RadC
MDRQYKADCARLAALIEKYTNIPQGRAYHFLMENTAEALLPCANLLCKTEAQKEKLAALFEFKNLYETIKSAEESRAYQFAGVEDAKAYFRSLFADEKEKELFIAAYLDPKNQVIKTRTISTGTVGQANVYPREIFKEALFVNAYSVIIAHNHVSSDATPSRQDMEVTGQIKQGLELVGVKLLDHIIVAGKRELSMLEAGHLSVDTVDRTETDRPNTGRAGAGKAGAGRADAGKAEVGRAGKAARIHESPAPDKAKSKGCGMKQQMEPAERKNDHKPIDMPRKKARDRGDR